MTRFASTTNQTAAAELDVRAFVAADLDFASGHIYVHDGIGEISFGGHTYEGVGKFGGVATVDEDISITARPVVLTLSGIDSSHITTLRDEVYQGRSATLYLGLCNDKDNSLLDTPETLWEGRMNQATLTWDGQSVSIAISCEPRLRREPRIARYTDADQQLAYSGDRFFELVPKIPGYRGRWGEKGVGGPIGSLIYQMKTGQVSGG